MAKFDHDFLLGAATAAHQVEGNNTECDFWTLEQMKHTDYAEPSLNACDHYHRYAKDIRLLAKAGLNAYRFSVEWARIEPEEGIWDEDALSHYSNVVDCCLENGVEPIVTLHHFSSPRWLIRKGGWEAESTVTGFARYASQVTEKLGDRLHYICTINEANMGVQMASIVQRYLMKMHGVDSKVQVGVNLDRMMAGSPEAAAEKEALFGTSAPKTFLTPRSENGDSIVMRAHRAARAAIRQIRPDIKVGLTLSLHDIQSQLGGEVNAAEEWDREFLHYLPCIKEDDFLGVQNYTRMQIGASGQFPVPEDAELTQMGYEFYPEALENVIRKVSKEYHGDILVTENGIATANDARRIAFISRATDGVVNCIRDGLPVRAYLYWSLLDNFEWQKGYSMTFGLISVNRETQERTPKDSLRFLGAMRQQTT